jgi:putative flippase GtrA
MTVLARQFTLFTLVGVVGTLAHYLLLVILVDDFAITPVLASMAGALLGSLVNYALNYRFNFASTLLHKDAMPKFLAVAGIGLCLNAVFMWITVDGLGFHYLLGQVFATVLVLVWNFVGNRVWTFGEPG